MLASFSKRSVCQVNTAFRGCCREWSGQENTNAFVERVGKKFAGADVLVRERLVFAHAPMKKNVRIFVSF